MDDSTSPVLFPYLGIAVLVVWILYVRLRRMVGRQRLRIVRPWSTAIVFSFLVALLLLVSLGRLENALALLGGVLAGAALGTYGLRLTRFENTESGLFYTPNAHLGLLLVLLFVARIAYRGFQLYLVSDLATAQPEEFMSSPLTLALFGALAGYYVCYAVGLIRSAARFASQLE